MLAFSDLTKKLSHLQDGYGYSGSSCIPTGKAPCSVTSLKGLCANAHSVGNKQEELEICERSQGHSLIAITEAWRDSSHDWNAVINGYMLSRKDRPVS